MKKTKILLILLILIICITLSGCNKKHDENKDLKEKVKQELNFMDNQIISMLNRLNNISLENYSIVSNETELNEKSSDESTSNSGEEKQTNQEETGGGTEAKQNNQITTTELKPETILNSNQSNIDWDIIENEIETLNNSWSIILLDLYNINATDSDISGFSDKINTCIINIENKDKNNTEKTLGELYSYIPKYMETTDSNDEQRIKKSKSYLLNSYIDVDNENWEEAENNLAQCKNEFNDLVNNKEFNQNKEYKTNKVAILIKEMENSLSSKNKKVFYIKYKNLLQAISSI